MSQLLTTSGAAAIVVAIYGLTNVWWSCLTVGLFAIIAGESK